MCEVNSREYYSDEEQELFDKYVADGVVTDEEVSELWAIKDAKKNNTSGDFDTLFTTAVLMNIMADGVFSEEEGTKLAERMLEDGSLDDSEEALLENIIEKWEDGDLEVPESFKSAFPDSFNIEDDDDSDEE